ncbi:MAG: sigma-70 family RNA polymerase sigma factor [Sedimentisphaerales bacterium]|jgi:RNA polymerase sigma-70 factor (ECF subfamily)
MDRSASIEKGRVVRTDAELVRAVIHGEKQVFAALVKRYEKPVHAVALDILGDHHLAADVSQDAFVKAYEHLRGLRKPQAFGPWLMKITRRRALHLARGRSKEVPIETGMAEEVKDCDGRLDENKQRLLSAIVKLPKAEQQVVMLRYFSDKTVNDVARILDRSVGTVTKQLSRARLRLRAILERSEQ